MLNALTIDVEDYFHVAAFSQQVRPAQWDSYPLRVEANIYRILDLLDEFHACATFFVLGWVAKRLPWLVREIRDRGHEIASHGYGHQLVYRIGPDMFRQDITVARDILEGICGERVQGYRAPSYSITQRSMWALDILVEEGFTYDSSIFPIIHDIYGIPNANRFPGSIACASGRITEFPLSTLPFHLRGKEFRLPIAGGGYLRLFPVWVIKRAFQAINEVEKQPGVLYFHPWEIDPDQPRISTGYKSHIRHYLNLHSTERKLRTLLADLRFGTMRQVLDNCL